MRTLDLTTRPISLDSKYANSFTRRVSYSRVRIDGSLYIAETTDTGAVPFAFQVV